MAGLTGFGLYSHCILLNVFGDVATVWMKGNDMQAALRVCCVSYRGVLGCAELSWSKERGEWIGEAGGEKRDAQPGRGMWDVETSDSQT